jgi:hypothetical protein
VFIGKPITLDGQNQATITGDNARDRWVQIYSSDVTIRNFVMRDANTALQEGAICTCQVPANNVVIDHNDLGATLNGEQIGIGGTTNSRVTNNQIHGGGQLGIGTYQNTNLLISGNHVYGNNTAGVDPGFGAGGIKAVQDNGAQLLGNEVDHNAGPGIWVDIHGMGYTIANNNVHDQNFNPIIYEVSSHGEIANNTVTNVPLDQAHSWGCIISSSSGDVNIHDNTCVNTPALLVLYDNRTDRPADAGTNIKLQNNRIQNLVPDPNQSNPVEPTRWWEYDFSLPFLPGQNNNVDSGSLGQ